MKLTSMKVQALCIFALLLVVGTSSGKSDRCPFNYLYHFGDTTTDIGNSVLIKPWGPHLPAAHPPYGMTYPGYPTGRWCDGRIDFDYTAADYGLPNIVPSLGLNGSTEYDGIMFSVARSPVLDRSFFEARGIEIPPFCVSLNGQMKWFKEHLNAILPTPEAIAERLQDSVIFMGDLEGNDVIYGLTQGKSFEEVETYVPYIVEAQVNVIRELIAMGAWRFMFPGNLPVLGCTPYLLTELASNNPNDYDDQGCLNTINELVQYKNRAVQEAIANLRKEFPDVFILYIGGSQEALRSHIKNKSSSDPEENIALKACCGVGGRYNFDSKRFCGSPEATVCSNPDDYMWWDGMHFTQETYRVLVEENMPFALRSLNCTTSVQLSASM